MKNIAEKLEFACEQCAEFFADILVDPYRNSLVVNIETRYFEEVGKILTSCGFHCVHITEFRESVTACFILVRL